MVLKAGTDARWYGEDGAPAPGATVKDARGKKLFASVTSILGVIRKQGIETWKLENVARTAHGWVGDFDAGAIIAEADRGSRGSADLGTAIHALAEKWAGGAADSDDLLAPVRAELDMIPVTLGQLRSFVAEHPGTVEESFYSTGLKAGGRIDLYDDSFVYDYKSQYVEEGKRKPALPKFYPEWAWQLAAYAEGLRLADGKDRAIASVIVSTNPDAQGVFRKDWTRTEQADGLAVFKAATRIFYVQRKYTFG